MAFGHCASVLRPWGVCLKMEEWWLAENDKDGESLCGVVLDVWCLMSNCILPRSVLSQYCRIRFLPNTEGVLLLNDGQRLFTYTYIYSLHYVSDRNKCLVLNENCVTRAIMTQPGLSLAKAPGLVLVPLRKGGVLIKCIKTMMMSTFPRNKNRHFWGSKRVLIFHHDVRGGKQMSAWANEFLCWTGI